MCIAGSFSLDATCTACARGTYKAPGTASCAACPANSNTQQAASSVRTACTCNIGFLGALGGTCVNESETAVLLSPVPAPAPPDAEAPPAGTPALVKVQLSLPITASEFRAKQASFVDAIAAAAGPSVTSQDVIIKSVIEVSRRLLVARKVADLARVVRAAGAALEADNVEAHLALGAACAGGGKGGGNLVGRVVSSSSASANGKSLRR
jgi:hypothetical protein